MRLAQLHRREVLVAGAQAAAVGLLLGRALPADAQTATQASTPALPAWEAELRRILRDTPPSEGKVAIELQEIVDNGNTVPFTVSVTSPMTPENYVKSVHVLTTSNPQPIVAAFRFTPDSGVASVSSRMRLVSSQDVVIVAEISTGAFVLARRTVKVIIGCCGR